MAWMKQGMSLAVVALIVLPSPAFSFDGECPAERAVYTLNSDTDFSAGFIPAKHFASMASNLYFRVTSPQRSYWFTLITGNGYTRISLRPVGDPYVAADGDPDNGPVELTADPDFPDNLRLYPMGRNFDIAENPPSAGEPAPYGLFAPELGTMLWYAPRSVSGDASAERDPMKRGVFLLSDCLAAAPPPALP